ncbi:hypothetical protein [Amycolatopsis eburnea]|uniref:Uncharacterized protein n=1 Tax=Amycolatopsis eburnea TaxID=2267691 RepID=A0A3R9EB74_9PSEU|nr:hypothetical protein [Amycolatopsis eburnea]RSD26386.1 hypothetical protein EIY87_00545 [Amycolatopsis eburnea]
MSDEDRSALARRMEDENIRRDVSWEEVSAESGLSTALLRNIRTGKSPVTRKSAHKIELFYGWPAGEVQRLLTPADPSDEEIAGMSARELAAYALRVERTRGVEARRAWLKHAYAVWREALGPAATDSPEWQVEVGHSDA